MTIAQQLKVTNFPFIGYDGNGNRIYWEDRDQSWWKAEHDSNNNEIYYENSDNYWGKRKYDSNNNQIYWENSNGHWGKQEYDSNNNEIYYEDSKGIIRDKRSKQTLKINNMKPKFKNYIDELITLRDSIDIHIRELFNDCKLKTIDCECLSVNVGDNVIDVKSIYSNDNNPYKIPVIYLELKNGVQYSLNDCNTDDMIAVYEHMYYLIYEKDEIESEPTVVYKKN